MSKTMVSKIEAQGALTQVLTQAIIEAGRVLTNEEIKAILDRLGEMLESEE
jgi:hypothetical protein